jgi:hypothetical protein
MENVELFAPKVTIQYVCLDLKSLILADII